MEDIVKRDFYFSEKAGVRTFIIQSNDNFEVQSLTTWLKVTSCTKNASLTTLQLEADGNLGEQRKGELKFIYSNKSELLLDVYQWSSTSISVNQTRGGNLRYTFAQAGESDAQEITVTGKVAEIDIRFLSNIVESLTLLDLGGAEAEFESFGFGFSDKQATEEKCVLILPQGLEKIGSLAFTRSTLFKDIIIPNSVTEICSHAFSKTTLDKIDWSSTNIRDLQEGVFKKNLATEIILPKTLERVGSATFAGCSNLKKIDMPNSVKEIGIIAFFDCTSLEELILSPTLEKIDRMLSNNPALKKLRIPASVKQIRMIYQKKTDENKLDQLIIEGAPVLEEMAFDNVLIKELVLQSSIPPPNDKDSFMSAPFKLEGVEKVIIPVGSLAAYKAAPIWKDYGNFIEQ